MKAGFILEKNSFTYPIQLHIQSKACTVIGGGKVALRKVKSLLQAGAKITLVAPQLTPELLDYAKNGLITLLQRDFLPGDTKGAFLVIASITLAILFLGGANGKLFSVFSVAVIGAFVLMIVLSPWRRDRIFAYLNPWSESNALGSAYQLSHALIAMGRGEWFGVGLGGSIEKLHYLPEAHTDFLLAIIGEELGLVGVGVVIFAFYWIVRRAFDIGRQALVLDRMYSALVAQGIGVWIGGHAFINIGVNLGLLPTKGLTLPLMSYGGSALLLNCMAIAVLLRVDFENRILMRGGHV